MRGSFLFNIILALVINLLIKPLYIFGIEIPVQNVVEHEAYGMYFAFLNLGFILQILSDGGLQAHTLTYLPKDPHRAKALFSSSLILKAALASLFMMVAGAGGAILGYWALDAKLFVMVMLNILLLTMMQHLRAFVSGMGYYMLDTLCSVLDKALLILAVGYLLYVRADDIRIHDFVLAQTFTLVLSILILLIILRKDLGWVSIPRTKLKQHLHEAAPLGLIITLMFLYTRMDAIMIEQLMLNGTEEAGRYASAYRIYDSVVMLFYLFAPLLLPMMARFSHEMKELWTLYFGGLKINQVSVSLIAWILAVYAPHIMDELYTNNSTEASQTLRVFMIALVFKAGSFVSTSLLTSQRRLTSMIILFVTTVVVNFVLNLFMIPSMGIVGAAWATVITHVWMAIGLLWLCERLNQTKQNRTYRLILFFALLSSTFYYIMKDTSFNLTSVLQSLGASALLFLFWVWLDRSHLTQLLVDVRRQDS